MIRDYTRLTLRYISGFELSLLIAGYAIPAKFQTMGFSESANLNDARSMYRMTSEMHSVSAVSTSGE